MMFFLARSGLALLAILTFAPWATADASETLAETLSNVQSLRAEFTQTVRDEHGEELQASSGTILIKQPQKLYWETKDPYQHTPFCR